MRTIPETAKHPHWCAEEHNEDYPVHAVEIGVEDIVLTVERELAVELHQDGDDRASARVWLVERGAMTSAVTELTPDAARELADRVNAAVDLYDGIVIEGEPQ